MDTPPPITNTSGSTINAIFPAASANFLPRLSTCVAANSSPALAASKMSFDVTSVMSFSVVDFSYFLSAFFVSYTIPVAEA